MQNIANSITRSYSQNMDNKTKYNIFKSPIGKLTVSADGAHITGLHIENDKHFTQIPTNWIQDTKEPLLKQAEKELGEYFSGNRKQFDLPLAPNGTPFQKIVWQELHKIKPGSTSTYSQ